MAYRSSRRKGGSYIEVVVTILLVGISLLAALNLFGFSMQMTEKTGDEGVAYNLLRRSVESVRSFGFSSTLLPDGTTTAYYDSMGLNPTTTQTSNSRFRVVRQVSTDLYTQTETGPRPSDVAMRSVRIQVFWVPSGEQVCETATMVVRSGV